ncbi:divalent metal cation transporter [Candidatus Woesearchaeota archaeon]|nr:MAG: divalent metal cation transporter [Candidatus Woesearchaeota archaeon]
MFRKSKKGNEVKIGPGLITGGADNDPAGIITYTIAGSLFGYAPLWILLLCTPIMAVVQEMAARIALVKRKGLASLIKQHDGKTIATIVIAVLAVANLITISADIAGIASVIGLMTGINWTIFTIPIALLLSYLIIFKKYKTIRTFLLGLTFLLVFYVISAILTKPDWISILKGFVPSFPSSGFIPVAIGIIGTTIAPYMLFWQASDELEEHKTIFVAKEMKLDTILGMLWSNVIAGFIIIAAAATLFSSNTVVSTPAHAALALRPLAGELAYLLFSFGIIFSGFLALPVIAGSTAYAISGLFGWHEGLDKKPRFAKGFYFTIITSLLLGAFVSFIPINPVKFLYYSQVLNGFLTPFVIVVLLKLCSSKKIMKQYRNTKTQTIIAFGLILILCALDVFFITSII